MAEWEERRYTTTVVVVVVVVAQASKQNQSSNQASNEHCFAWYIYIHVFNTPKNVPLSPLLPLLSLLYIANSSSTYTDTYGIQINLENSKEYF